MRSVLRLAGPLRWLFVIVALLAAAAGALKVVTAHALGRIVAAAVARDPGSLRAYAALGIAAVAAHTVVGFLQASFSGWLAQTLLARVRRSVASRLAGATAEALRARHSGDVASRMSSDLASLDYLSRDGLPTLLARLILSVLAAGYMLYHDWWLTLIALAPVPFLLFLSSRIGRPLGAMGKEAQEALGQASVQMKEAVAGAALVRASRMQRVLSLRMGASIDRWADASAAQAARVGLLYASGMLMSIAPWIAVFSAGGYSVVRGAIDLGVLFSFAEVLGAVSFPLTELPGLWGQIKPRFAAADRVLGLLDVERERAGGEPAVLDGAPLLALEGVTLTFPGREQPSLRDVHLAVERGQAVALVGASGSGKSTVLALLLGELSPQEGEVLFGGRPVRSLDLASLRRHFAVADGDAFLFDASIEENLRLARPGATGAELAAAARAAEADGFIEGFPEGYATPVGETGERLSGGQRQRISLARALLPGAPILVLDEATSGVEEDMEIRIFTRLRSRPDPPTLIVATHRLRAVRGFDVIFVLDAGRVIAAGSHEELLERCEVYARLHHLGEGGAP